MRHGQLTITPKLNFTRNFYRLTGAARQKTAKRKTPEIRQSEKTRTKKKLHLKNHRGNPWHTKQKMISNLESPSFKREIISTHILEYKD